MSTNDKNQSDFLLPPWYDGLQKQAMRKHLKLNKYKCSKKTGTYDRGSERMLLNDGSLMRS